MSPTKMTPSRPAPRQRFSMSQVLLHGLLALTYFAVTSVTLSQPSLTPDVALAPDANWFFRGLRIALIVVAIIYAPRIALRLKRDIPVALGIGFLFISSIWSADPIATIAAASFIFLVVAFLSACDAELGADSTLYAIWVYTFGTITISLILAVTSSPYALTRLGEWRGLFSTKNTFGTVCALLVISSIVAANIRARHPRLRYVAIIVGMAGLLGAKSAGALMATFAAIGLTYSLGLLNRLRTRWPGVFIPGALLITTLAGALGFLLPNVIVALGRDLTFTGRTDLWAAVLPLTFKQPLGSGYGLSGGATALEAISQRIGYVYRAVDSAYIVTALDLGWGFCLLFVLWLLYLMFGRRFTQLAVAPGLVGSIAAFMLLLGFVEKSGGPYLSLPLFLLFIGETAAVSAASRDLSRSDKLRNYIASTRGTR